MDTETRSKINQALAKCIAYRDCGAQRNVALWAVRLVQLLEVEGILDDNAGIVRAARGED